MDLMDYLKSAKKSLFRWEALQEYRFDGEDDGMEEWWSFIKEKNASGVITQRVRLIVFPCTPYTVKEISLHKISAQHGDDIRFIDSKEYGDELMADYWLIDDATVLLMHYGEHGEYEGFSVNTNRLFLEAILAHKMKALSLSTPIKDLNL